MTTAANVNDVTQTLALVDGIPPVAGRPGRPRRRPDALLGDKGYDSNPNRDELRKRRILPVISRKGAPNIKGMGKRKAPTAVRSGPSSFRGCRFGSGHPIRHCHQHRSGAAGRHRGVAASRRSPERTSGRGHSNLWFRRAPDTSRAGRYGAVGLRGPIPGGRRLRAAGTDGDGG
ncbi:transposase [Streptomyces sp. NBC_01244]|uniref:transposase n=1 Tax=Streptomyces sp. NBC_01244 TaxID=2903797 RepID=UPI003FA3A52C